MIRQFTITCLREHKIVAVVRALMRNLTLVAIILACGISFFLKTPIPIERSGVLVLGAFFILVPFRSEVANMLQKVAAFYLICVPVNQLSCQYYTLALQSVDVDVSYSSLVLFLCTIGYLAAGKQSNRSAPIAGGLKVLNAWILALVVIIIHIVLLGLALDVFYGYGYEHSLSVLGNLSLYFLLFMVLWRPLGQLYFRRRAALILALFYLFVTVAGPGLH